MATRQKCKEARLLWFSGLNEKYISVSHLHRNGTTQKEDYLAKD